MMNTLKCPVCGQSIEFDVYGLMKGEKYQCGNCMAVIGLPSSSSQVVRDAMDKLDKLRAGTAKAAVPAR